MKKISLFIFCLLGFGFGPLWAQVNATRTCGTTQLRQQLFRQVPAIELQMERVRDQVEALQQNKARLRSTRPVIQIPVVFHVVYNNAEQNISDEQLQSQIQVLNQDYRRRNPDTTAILKAFKSLAADTQVQFCLATVDPSGQPTTGITRTRTNVSAFALNEDVKFSSRGGKDAWNTSRYLNIWICNLENGLLGHAQWPGSPPSIDGVVLLYKAVGRFPANPNANYPFNQGRTATHEVGHWLGLEHIWGTGDSGCEDSDGIADTPPQDDANGGCPTGTVTSCSNAAQGGDMYQNFMDYTDDACMHLFTKGQANYMYDLISAVRPGLLTAVTCAFPLRADFSVSDSVIVTGTTVKFTDNSIGLRATSWQWNFEGGTPAASSQPNPSVTYSNPGIYPVSLTVKSGNYSDTRTKTGYILVTRQDPMLYPNPAQHAFAVEIPANYEVQSVVLINAVGQEVRRWSPRENIVWFSLRGINSGMYYVRILQRNGQVTTKKLVVLQGD